MSQNDHEFEEGFTIIELLIALTVLSMILAMSSFVMMQIGKMYTKGINQSNLQNATRNLLQDVTSAMQFTGDSVSSEVTQGYPEGDVKARCIGSVRYTYTLGRKMGVDMLSNGSTRTTRHVMWRDSSPSPTACAVAGNIITTTPASGYEMMPENTQITAFNILPVGGGGVYRVQVYGAYGDSELLTFPGGSGSKPSCLGGKGTQYCAISITSSSVSKRL